MGIIQKRADELKPGDIFVWGGSQVVALHVDARPSDFVVLTALLGERESRTSRGSYPLTSVMDVESPDLTTAQQQAEELAKFAERYLLALDSMRPYTLSADEHAELRDLLDKVKPPEPPTLAEALEMLGDAIDSLPIHKQPLARNIADLLDRGRRAGVIK